MKTSVERGRWSRGYARALRRHVAGSTGAGLTSAFRLGHRAAAMGMDTLDLAAVHEAAIRPRPLPCPAGGSMQRAIARAGAFFAECLVPIEATHDAARKAGVRVDRLSRALRGSAKATTSSRRRLVRGVARRRAAEAALARSRKRLTALMKVSCHLQDRMRRHVRAALAGQEDERGRGSRRLHDEIAQTLLAIHIRLLTLKTTTAAGTRILEMEIAGMQRLVKQSVGILHRVTHDFGGGHEA